MGSIGRRGWRRHVGVVALATLAGSIAAASACSLLVPLNEVQCSRAADCAARGFANATCTSNLCVPVDGGTIADAAVSDDRAPPPAADPWDCLDYAPEPSDPTLLVDVKFITFDTFATYTLGSALDGGTAFTLLDYTPLPGTSIYGCYLRDVNCQMPGTATVVSDEAGVAELKLHGDSALFYHIDHSSAFPGLYFPGRLLAKAPEVTYPVAPDMYALSGPIEAMLGVKANMDSDGGPGHLFVSVFDCEDRPLGDVSVKLLGVDAGVSFYIQDLVPTRTATTTDSLEGTAGFVNVPTGAVRIRSTLGNRQLVVNVLVRSGSTTFVDVRPRVRTDPATIAGD